MTTVAGTYHGVMVDPAHPSPTEGGVTEITGVVGPDMGRLFADCPVSVMAAKAIIGDAVMIEACQFPIGGGMAVITLIITLNVIGGLARGLGIVVASATAYRRPHEDPADMATVTLHISMTAGQRKAGGKVVITTVGSRM